MREPYRGGVGIVVTPAPPSGTPPPSGKPHDPWAGVRSTEEETPVNKIEMKALQYQSVPQGNEKQYVDTDGTFFVYSEQEALARVERKLAERISPEAPTEAETTAANQEQENAEGDWKLQLTPEEYIERYPDGPNTKLAKSVIAKRKAEGTGDSA